MSTSSLGTVPVCLEIIATTYHPTIFKTQVFSLCYHLGVYVSIYIWYIWTGWRGWLRATRGAPEDDDRVYSEKQLYVVIV